MAQHEYSAGGILVSKDKRHFAAIRPKGRPSGFWQLPKGLIDSGESPLQAALREVKEETGVRPWPAPSTVMTFLDELRYVYLRGQERVFKVVRFYRMVELDGDVNDLDETMRVEIADVAWLPLGRPDELAYRSEEALVCKVAELEGVPLITVRTVT